MPSSLSLTLFKERPGARSWQMPFVAVVKSSGTLVPLPSDFHVCPVHPVSVSLFQFIFLGGGGGEGGREGGHSEANRTTKCLRALAFELLPDSVVRMLGCGWNLKSRTLRGFSVFQTTFRHVGTVTSPWPHATVQEAAVTTWLSLRWVTDDRATFAFTPLGLAGCVHSSANRSPRRLTYGVEGSLSESPKSDGNGTVACAL